MGSIDAIKTNGHAESVRLRQPGIFGQLCFDSYTIITLGFAVDDSHRDAVLQNFDEASLKLTAAFPFIGGQIIIEGRTSTSSGLYKIVPYSPHNGHSVVRRKDCTTLLPSYFEMVSAKAPFTMLDGDIISPMPGFGAQLATDIPWPVLVIQANIVSGGLLLTFASEHNALDMNGQGQLIKLFSTACNNQSFDPLDVKLGNEDPVQALLNPGEKSIDLSVMKRPSMLTSGPPAPPPCTWTYWRCPASVLANLKSSSQAYSTNDALCAFYFRSICAARIALGEITPSEPIHFGRAANARKPMGLTDKHMGHSVAHADTLLLPTDSLIHIASELRKTLGTIDGNWTRSAISHIANTEDKTTIFYGGMHRAGKDVILSSWAHHSLYQLEFGTLLGKPGFCRRPKMGIVPDLAYFMPKTREGDLDVALCLRQEEVDALREVQEWEGVMKYIG